MKTKKPKIMLIRVPPDVHKEIKILAARDGLTFEKVIRNLLKRNEKNII